MKLTKISVLLAIAATALALAGCKTTGSAVQGVGSVFNKTGGAISNIGS